MEDSEEDSDAAWTGAAWTGADAIDAADAAADAIDAAWTGADAIDAADAAAGPKTTRNLAKSGRLSAPSMITLPGPLWSPSTARSATRSTQP